MMLHGSFAGGCLSHEEMSGQPQPIRVGRVLAAVRSKSYEFAAQQTSPAAMPLAGQPFPWKRAMFRIPGRESAALAIQLSPVPPSRRPSPPSGGMGWTSQRSSRNLDG